MLKVALVGVGGISGAHISAWKKRKDSELVAVCDIRPEQTKQYAEINRYTDFDDMINNETIDILDVCVPTYLHVEYSAKAMKRGINVICEKPVSLNREDVAYLYGLASENNVTFMVAQVLRFWREYKFLKNIYDNNTYGKLLSGSMRRLGPKPTWSYNDWMSDEKLSGLVPYDLHIHDLDFLVYSFGKPKDVTSFRSKRPEQDYICAVYDYGDFFISAETSWFNAPYTFRAEFRFQFAEAVIALENGEFKIYESDGTVIDVNSDDYTADNGDIGLPRSDAYAEEIDYFTNCVKNGGTPDAVKCEELETVIDILNSL